MTEHDDPIKQDFRNFLHVAWKYLGYTDSELQYDIGHYLQHGPDRLMVTAMRGAGKSVITSAFIAWTLYCNPNATVLVASAASVRSRELIRFTRRMLEMPICQHLIPNEGDRDGADRFDCGARTNADKNPSVAAYGINAMITGTHVDLIVADDIETRGNSLTIDARDKLYSQSLEFESVLNPGGRIVYLGTPQSISSVYIRMAKHYAVRKWPAVYPSLDDQDGIVNLSPTLLQKIKDETVQPGDSTFPEKFSEITLLERQAIMGPTEWTLQMLLSTRLSDAMKYPLKAKDFIVYTTSGDMAPRNISWGTSLPVQIPCAGLDGDRFYAPIYTDAVFESVSPKTMYVDPAGTGGDETGVAIGCALNGFLYVQLATGVPGGHGEENMIRIAKMALAFGVKRILVEPNYGDGMFTKALMPHVLRICGQVAVEDDKRVLNTKEIRICDTVEAPLSNHRIVISEQVAHDEDFIYQLTHITRDPGCLRHDDRIDAFAGLVRSFSSHIQIDVVSRIEKADQAAREAAYRDFEISWKQTKLGRKVVKGSPNDPHVPGNKQFSKAKWGRPMGW